MSFTTYPGFLDQLTRLIDGEDTNVSEVAPHTLKHIVSLGERRIYREVRSRWNVKSFTTTAVTANLAPIPEDWESTDTIHFGKQSMLPETEDQIRARLLHNASGEPFYFASAGASFTFAPAIANGTLLQGRYFARLPDLSATTFAANNLILKEPDLFLYGCLSQSAPFYGQDNRLQMWEARYTDIRDAINNGMHRAAFSAGQMRVSPSTKVLR